MNYFLNLNFKRFLLIILSSFLMLIFGFLNNISFLSFFSIKINLIVIFFVLIQNYFTAIELIILSLFSGIAIGWLYLDSWLFLIRFIALALVIVFLKEKILAKDNTVSLILFFILGIVIFEFNGRFEIYKNITFIKELIFGNILLIISLLIKERFS